MNLGVFIHFSSKTMNIGSEGWQRKLLMPLTYLSNMVLCKDECSVHIDFVLESPSLLRHPWFTLNPCLPPNSVPKYTVNPNIDVSISIPHNLIYKCREALYSSSIYRIVLDKWSVGHIMNTLPAAPMASHRWTGLCVLSKQLMLPWGWQSEVSTPHFPLLMSLMHHLLICSC